MDHAQPTASALAVKGGAIIYVGAGPGVLSFIGGNTRVIDLDGRLVLPGFIDSHTHAPCGADEVFSVILNRMTSIAGYRQAIQAFLQAHPETEILRGVGWHPPLFPPCGPTRQLLDEWVPGIPAALYAQDYHNVWLNTPALELAGITRDTPDPFAGIIERDQSGDPSGTLRESAMDLVERVLPPYTVDQLVAGLGYFQQTAHSYGLTGVNIPHLGDVERELAALCQMEDDGALVLHVVAGLQVPPGEGIAALQKLVEKRAFVEKRHLDRQKAGKTALFALKSAKLFIDGVIEGGTAYLDQPYAHRPSFRGEPLWDIDAYQAVCAALHRAGFSIHVHAIGDAAVRFALDGIAHARQAAPLAASAARPPHAITHLQLVDPADISRFAALGVAAVPQPYWFVIDPFYDLALEYLGRERADRQYPMKSFFDSGVLVASASDYPVTIPPRPLDAIENGVTRAKLGETDPARVLNPAERVTVEQMVASFTINGARALGLDALTGSLQPGKRADLLVLDQDIFELPPSQIHTAQVLLTLFNGKEVHRSPAF